MTKSEAIDKVTDILKEKLKVSENILVDKNYDAWLTGDIFNLSDIEMTYLAFELNNIRLINFDEATLLNYNFASINKIADNILTQCAAVQ